MANRAPFTDLPSLLTWLDTLTPVDRVHVGRLIADTGTAGTVSRAADAVVYDMTRTATQAQVAQQLGTTVRSVQRAVSNHIRAGGGEQRRGPKRKIRAPGAQPQEPADA